MPNKEFDLRVLKNATSFQTSVKKPSDYEAIFSLIKEEIDLDAIEDDAEYPKTPRIHNKRKKSWDDKTVFKSPCRKVKTKSSGTLLFSGKHKLNRSLKEHETNGCNRQKVESLGMAKPGRSFKLRRKHKTSISQSETSSFSDSGDVVTIESPCKPSDYVDPAIVKKTPQKQLKNRATDGGASTIQADFVIHNTEENLLTIGQDDPTSITCNDSLDSADKDESFVESSQSTTISNLRKILNLRRISTEIKPKVSSEIVNKSLENGHIESEEDTHFSLVLSPDREMHKFNGQRCESLTPPRPKTSKIRNGLASDELSNIATETEGNLTPLQSEKSKTKISSPIKPPTQKPPKIAASLSPSPSKKEDPPIENAAIKLTDDLTNISIKFEVSPSPPSRNLRWRTPCPLKTFNEDKSSPTPPKQNKEKHENEEVARLTKDLKNVNRKKGTNRKTPNRKRKKINNDSPMKDITRILPNRITPSRLRNRSTIPESPLKGLTQELENCLSNTDYDAMCNAVEADMEAACFSFETIQLLDDYSDAHQQADNQTLSKILSAVAPNSSDEEQPLEDPLYIKESESETSSSSVIYPKRKRAKSLNGRKKISKTSAKRKRRTSAGSKMILNDPFCEDGPDISEAAAEIAKNVAIATKKLAVTAETFNEMKELFVKLRHQPLPQHEIESRAGSTTLSYKEQKRFMKFAHLSKDHYTPEEDEIIKTNWNDFCKDHNWDCSNYRPFLLLRHGDKQIMSGLSERRKFVQFLANGLPNRPLYSVYSRFRRLYSDHASAGLRYTEEEDSKILLHLLHNPDKVPDKKCAELAKILNKSRTSIWQRYKKLLEKTKLIEKEKVKTKIEWSLEFVGDFITTLLDVTLSDELLDLKNAFIPKVVWQKVEQKMRIDHRVLKRFWEQQLHLQLFSPKPLYLSEIKIKLIEHMYPKKITHPGEIKWQSILGFFDGLTVPFLRKIFNHLKERATLVLQTRDFNAMLEWLHTIMLDRLSGGPEDKCLPRVTYKDKKAELVVEDIDERNYS